VDTALRDIDEIIRTVQRISTDVRPAMLDDLGIGAAIEWQAGEFTRRTGIPCKVSLDPEEIVLDKNRSTALFRIFQESLTNISRHAGATSITVGLVMREGRMHLEIEDNGRGITGKEISAPRSFGLIGMRERVLPLGGEVEIRGVPGRGTTITVRLPLLEGEEVFQ
jgi:signal transduction histidine kinase